MKMTEKKQGRRSAKDAEETRFLIMGVAADMFCEQGYDSVSLRNISEKAGVSHSLIRHHFGSKRKDLALYKRLFARIFSVLHY